MSRKLQGTLDKSTLIADQPPFHQACPPPSVLLHLRSCDSEIIFYMSALTRLHSREGTLLISAIHHHDVLT